jgi:hypothetical protein
MKGTPATLMQQWRDEKAQKARLTSDPIDSFDASIHLHHVCIFKAHFPSSPFSLYPSSSHPSTAPVSSSTHPWLFYFLSIVSNGNCRRVLIIKPPFDSFQTKLNSSLVR